LKEQVNGDRAEPPQLHRTGRLRQSEKPVSPLDASRQCSQDAKRVVFGHGNVEVDVVGGTRAYDVVGERQRSSERVRDGLLI